MHMFLYLACMFNCFMRKYILLCVEKMKIKETFRETLWAHKWHEDVLAQIVPNILTIENVYFCQDATLNYP